MPTEHRDKCSSIGAKNAKALQRELAAEVIERGGIDGGDQHIHELGVGLR